MRHGWLGWPQGDTGTSPIEAVLLIADLVGFALVMLWFAKGRGDQGLFAWSRDAQAPKRRGD